jgi:hypothetical protein
MRRPRIGIVRPLPPDDPRSLDHPSHKEQWLKVADALGELLADLDWDRLHGGEHEEGRRLRKVFDRSSKRDEH